MKLATVIFNRTNSSAVDLIHIPVLCHEINNIFNSSFVKTSLDFTFGYGGHCRQLLSKSSDAIFYVNDRDKIAYNYALELQALNGNVRPMQKKFGEIDSHLKRLNIPENSIDFMLMDLGFSSMQMDDGDRGFAISKDAHLDMRMSPDKDWLTAYDVVNYLDTRELASIFKAYGEVKNPRKIAASIVDYRLSMGPIVSTKQLANLIKGIADNNFRKDSIGRYSHPATLVFQALRIFVNDELNELCHAIDTALRYLTPDKGRLAIVSFHSLEHRIVSRLMANKTASGLDKRMRAKLVPKPNKEQEFCWEPIGDVICATEQEISENPRSRSAQLRVARKIKYTS